LTPVDIRRLRGPGGCPWDLAQTPETLRENLLEEAYECVSAIGSADDENLREELGDLSMLVTMIAWMKEEKGGFTLSEVFNGISEKLIRRHPHVFGDSRELEVGEVVGQWEKIKNDEKGFSSRSPTLGRVPMSLPPLERALRIQEKVSKVGFDWGNPDPLWEKLDEEINELRNARERGDSRRVEEETGDVLFTVVNLSRLLGVDPGLALHGTNEKFMRRFQKVEQRLKASGLEPAEAGLSRMDEIWNQIKGEERNSSK
jgi:tetrapyrrole methylase family protein/MazG family protein